MISDELWNSLPPNGWLHRNEAELLMDVANDTEGPILEVGVYYGRSTCLLATLRRVIYAVDPFYNFDSDDPSGDNVCKAFQDNLSSRSIHNVILSRCLIEQWHCRPASFAYLDGDHTTAGTTAQIKAARDCGATELCIHDFDTKGGGLAVAKAIWGWPLEIVEQVNSMVHCRFRN